MPDGRRARPQDDDPSRRDFDARRDSATFRASGKAYDFLGWRRAYIEDVDEGDEVESEARLPAVVEGAAVTCTELASVGHETKPPARYTEASLVKELEERGIGRPSTYAAVIETIQARSYVWRKGTALVPAWTAFAVTNLLERHFGHLVDYSFTATMEEALDVIARGEGEAEKWLHSFYYGNGTPGLHELVDDEHLALINPRGVSTIPIGTDDTGHEIIVRVGRYGPYVQREDNETASLPPDIAPDELTVALALELIAKQSEGPRDARRRSRDRAARVRAHRSVRSVRAARRAARRHEEEAEAGVAVRDDDARDR